MVLAVAFKVIILSKLEESWSALLATAQREVTEKVFLVVI